MTYGMHSNERAQERRECDHLTAGIPVPSAPIGPINQKSAISVHLCYCSAMPMQCRLSHLNGPGTAPVLFGSTLQACTRRLGETQWLALC